MKRVDKGLLFFSILLIIFLVGMVSAAEGDLSQLVSDFISGIFQALRPLFELLTGTQGSDDLANLPKLFIGKLLLILIVFSVVYASLRKSNFFVDSPWVLWIIS